MTAGKKIPLVTENASALLVLTNEHLAPWAPFWGRCWGSSWLYLGGVLNSDVPGVIPISHLKALHMYIS